MQNAGTARKYGSEAKHSVKAPYVQYNCILTFLILAEVGLAKQQQAFQVRQKPDPQRTQRGQLCNVGNHGQYHDVQGSRRTETVGETCIPGETSFTLAPFPLIFCFFPLASDSLLWELCMDPADVWLREHKCLEVQLSCPLIGYSIQNLLLIQTFVELN